MKRLRSKSHAEDAAKDADDESTDIEPERASSHRSCCLMWTFPTPKEYRKVYVDRRKNLEYVPDDFSREDIALLFLNALQQVDEHQHLEELIVVQEPHKTRAGFHYHFVFKMRTPFAHQENVLACENSCRGNMSHPKKGWRNMAHYVLRKDVAPADQKFDSAPYFWPKVTLTRETMLEKPKCEQEDREHNFDKDEAGPPVQEAMFKKRKLSFRDFLMIAKANKIRDETAFWQIAGDQKDKGNNSLWNYGGSVKIQSMPSRGAQQSLH